MSSAPPASDAEESRSVSRPFRPRPNPGMSVVGWAILALLAVLLVPLAPLAAGAWVAWKLAGRGRQGPG